MNHTHRQLYVLIILLTNTCLFSMEKNDRKEAPNRFAGLQNLIYGLDTQETLKRTNPPAKKHHTLQNTLKIQTSRSTERDEIRILWHLLEQYKQEIERLKPYTYHCSEEENRETNLYIAEFKHETIDRATYQKKIYAIRFEVQAMEHTIKVLSSDFSHMPPSSN